MFDKINNKKEKIRIIILHDYLIQKGGGEKVLDCFLEIFPKTKVYTLLHNKKKFSKIKTKTSFIQYLPLKRYKFYMPLFPLAIKLFSPKADIILSTSHAYIKNISKPKDTLHICYCHTPMRYAWDLKEEYLKNENPILRPLIRSFLTYLKYWDKKNSKNVDFFVANSKNVQARIKKFYKRDSIVIYPPVDTKKFVLSYKPKKKYYLIVSRLIEYKKIDLAIKAFNKLNKKLIVIGSGRDEKRLKKLAKHHIEFKGYINRKKLVKYYQNAKALIHPQLEDAGISCLESQATGTPIIAYAKGGALETVIEGKTGHFFKKQSPEELIKAVKEFEKMSFNPTDCRKNALRFDKRIFKRKIKKFIEQKYKESI